MRDDPMADTKHSCSDCDGISRRGFLLGLGGAAVAAATVGGVAPFAVPRAAAAPAKVGKPDTLVAKLYEALTPEQRSAVAFGWDHPKRLAVSANWHIVPQKIGEFYTPTQREIIEAIFRSAHSPEWAEKRLKQMRDDAGAAGLGDYAIALFGTPESGKLEWVLTGRHLTLRVDGDSEPGVAFGGPIFYGHAAQGFNEKADHPGNVYWYQALRANQVYSALDGKQRERALQTNAVPDEAPSTIAPRAAGERPGLPVSDMTRDQRELVGKVLEDLLEPARKSDADEAMRFIQAKGGVESLNMAFYKNEDIGGDGVWDVWMLQGPGMVWYFRGAPHVHTWVYVGDGGKDTVKPG
jgi:hypothetical protein